MTLYLMSFATRTKKQQVLFWINFNSDKSSATVQRGVFFSSNVLLLDFAPNYEKGKSLYLKSNHGKNV